MERLIDCVELLDGPLDIPTLRQNLRDLARINRLLGGNELTWRVIEPLVGAAESSLKLLDVGTGLADLPRALAARLARAGSTLNVVATDVRPEIVGLAREASRSDDNVRVDLIEAGPLPYADREFDIAHASLVLHHLEPEAAVGLLREMARVSRTAVVVNDLDRRRRWWVGAWLMGHLLTGNRYTRHDGALSVRRAYRPDELIEMAATAGLREVARCWARPRYRYAIQFVHED
ncbi:MAG: methyltransferase domain-containing protein [Candidatus Limnocylindrales bacterium]